MHTEEFWFRTILVWLLSGLVGYMGIRIYNQFKSAEPSLLEKAQRKRVIRDTTEHACLKVPAKKECTSLTYRCGVKELQTLYREQSWTCVDMILAYCHRAHTHGIQAGAVAEEPYDEAMQLAFAEYEDSKTMDVDEKPLWGVPVSIKDHIEQKGFDSTCGLAARCFSPYKEDGLVVKALKDGGALPFVRSNVPQLLMLPECENAIWGRCVNPWDKTRTCGGSSGGCSPLGIGTDIGGSIRVPSSYCGVFGFKPTPKRITSAGITAPSKQNRYGQRIIPPTAGPVGRCVSDLVAMMKVLCNESVFAADPHTIPIPFDTATYERGLGRPLRIGFFTSDGWCEPHPAAQRAVVEAAEAMHKKGHECINVSYPEGLSGTDCACLFLKLIAADGNMYEFVKALEGEPLCDSYRTLYSYANMPDFLKGVVTKVLRYTGEHRKATLVSTQKNGGLSVREYWSTTADLADFEKAWVQHMQRLSLDALILPITPFPALPHGLTKELTPTLTLSFLGNLLQWPAGTVPTTRIAKGEATYDINLLPPFQRDSFARLIAKSMEGAEGLPVSVQVMTPRHRDELCLHVMQEVALAQPFEWKHYEE